LISEESKATLRALLDSEEGQRCLDEFAKIIAEWAAKAMPTELLQALGTDEGSNLLKSCGQTSWMPSSRPTPVSPPRK
jgi:hypothetical protein